MYAFEGASLAVDAINILLHLGDEFGDLSLALLSIVGQNALQILQQLALGLNNGNTALGVHIVQAVSELNFTSSGNLEQSFDIMEHKGGQQMKNVEIIKARNVLSPGARINLIKRLRVAAYCRVSTDSEDQLNSYKSQVKYYTDLIKSNSEWILSTYTLMKQSRAHR